jgi:hypothetical protein
VILQYEIKIALSDGGWIVGNGPTMQEALENLNFVIRSNNEKYNTKLMEVEFPAQ